MVESYRTAVNVVSWVLAGVSIVLVGSRMYARTSLVQTFGWDDGFMVVALAFALATSVLVSVATSYGFGLHAADILDQGDREMALKYVMIPAAVALMSTALSKISVMLFLIRLLGIAAKLVHKIILYTATAVMVGANILAIVILLAFCDPYEKTWRPYIPGKCMDPRLLDIAGRSVTVYNAAMDLLYAGFAIALVWTLDMKPTTKWGLAVLMSGGVFGTAASIVKAVMMSDIKNTADMTYGWGQIAIWYTAEMYVIIIAGSIPMLRPLWAAFRGRTYGSNKYTREGQNGYQMQGVGKSGKSSEQMSGHMKSTGHSTRGGAGPGMFTMALDELESDEDGSSRGGSSVDILHKPGAGIQIRRDVEVGYEPGKIPQREEARFKGERNAFGPPYH
ncbi:hypothetical protein AJ79_07876 [Helicocarpus griseus UAMH5409]|uniref:Rhodopsin domain-containing protein n=1 Tax=Helicocarpus griseus UAMH5409 TaxID=1447875 RepID=A0A2B7WYY3_9EURO|nr:hypothetical protein AJ79_07876 [Helicocarpus griseus UAMH5409]